MEKDLIDLRKLVQDIFYSEVKDTRFKILILQLYCEHYVNEIIGTYCKPEIKKVVRRHLTFPKKLDILVKEKVIRKEHERVFACLNSLRDDLVHELVINVEQFNQILDSHNLGINISYHIKTDNMEFKEDYDFSKIYKIYKTTKISQLEISVLCLIGYLHFQLNKIRGTELNQFIIPKKVIENNQLKIVFELMEKHPER